MEGFSGVLPQMARRIMLGLLAITLLLAALWAIEGLLYILSEIAQLVVGLLLKISAFKDIAEKGPWLNRASHLMVFLSALVLLYLFGCVFRQWLEQWFYRIAERLATKTPFLRSIYHSTVELSESFRGQKDGMLKRVVLVEHPRVGVYSIGFVTNDDTGNWEARARTGKDLLSVFIPSSPNPANGAVILVPRREVISLDMPIPDAMRLVISGGAASRLPWTGTPPRSEG